MEIHLVRHAHAGSRKGWDGSDRERPLSDRGWGQAEGIEKALADADIDHLWSSSYARCLQTLDPLADRLGLEIEVVDPLTEGGSGAEALDLLLSAARSGLTLAACSHGDVIPAVVATALGRGAQLEGPASAAKGGRYVLTVVDGQVATLRYFPPTDRTR